MYCIDVCADVLTRWYTRGPSLIKEIRELWADIFEMMVPIVSKPEMKGRDIKMRFHVVHANMHIWP